MEWWTGGTAGGRRRLPMLGLAVCAFCASVAWGYEVKDACAELKTLVDAVPRTWDWEDTEKKCRSYGDERDTDEEECRDEGRLKEVKTYIEKVIKEKSGPTDIFPKCGGEPVGIATKKEDYALKNMLVKKMQ